MQIIQDLQHYKPHPKQPLVLALGNFDGLHLAHQALLKKAVETAKRIGGLSAAFTFSIHPQCVLHPDRCPPFITSTPHKLSLLKNLGLDICFVIDFTPAFSKISSEDFVKTILVDRLKVHEVWMGYNARFGSGRSGDASTMQALAKRYGFYYESMGPVKVAEEIVSSSKIRSEIKKPDLERVTQMLGRPYAIWAKVVPGEGRGRELGFPTANLSTSEMLPPFGVYAVEVHLLQERPEEGLEPETAALKAVLNHGQRPTFHPDGPAVLEVHLLNFQGDLYSRELELRFLKKIRDEKTFSNREALKHQIESDICAAQSLFVT